MLFLEIIGGIVIFIVLLIISIYLFLKIKFGKWLNAALSDDNHSPLCIHLNEDLYPEWLENKKTKNHIQSFENHGFRSGKSYSIPEMDGVELLSLFKEPYTAVLYKHPIAGIWIDLFVRTNDDQEITVTNMPMGGEISSRPEMIKHVMKDSTLDEMMDRLYELTSQYSLKAIDEEVFRSIFEEAYKKDIQWRNRNGGISYDEFLSVEKESKGKYSETQIKEAFIETKLQELRQWHQAIIEQYTEINHLKDDETYELEWQSVIVPEKTDPVSYAHY